MESNICCKDEALRGVNVKAKEKRIRLVYAISRGSSTSFTSKCKHAKINLANGVRPAGFVFYAPRAGAARCAGCAGVWPFWAVRRSSEFGELGSL